MSGDLPLFTRDALPDDFRGPGGHQWVLMRKTGATRTVRIDGAFVVETPHGRVRCEDGWLALDAIGDPYPIAAEVMDSAFEPYHEQGSDKADVPDEVLSRADVSTAVTVEPRMSPGDALKFARGLRKCDELRVRIIGAIGQTNEASLSRLVERYVDELDALAELTGGR